MELSNAVKITLSKLYESVGGNLNDVLERLDDIEIVEQFVLRFPDDLSYTLLFQKLQENDLKSAFHAAHTLKGMSHSLGFDHLGNCATNLCEQLREGVTPSAILLHQLKTEYDCVIEAIDKFKENR